MTRARKAALAVLEAAAEPLSASGVLAQLGSSCDPATVYRALHHFEDRGLAESFIFHCDGHGTERYYISASAPHRHWFHCEACHRFIDLGACKVGSLAGELERERGLHIARHVLYFTGLCAECGGGGSGPSPA